MPVLQFFLFKESPFTKTHLPVVFLYLLVIVFVYHLFTNFAIPTKF